MITKTGFTILTQAYSFIHIYLHSCRQGTRHGDRAETDRKSKKAVLSLLLKQFQESLLIFHPEYYLCSTYMYRRLNIRYQYNLQRSVSQAKRVKPTFYAIKRPLSIFPFLQGQVFYSLTINSLIIRTLHVKLLYIKLRSYTIYWVNVKENARYYEAIIIIQKVGRSHRYSSHQDGWRVRCGFSYTAWPLFPHFSTYVH